MKKKGFKSLTFILMMLLLTPTLGLGGFTSSAEAKGEKVKVTISGILAHDSAGGGHQGIQSHHLWRR